MSAPVRDRARGWGARLLELTVLALALAAALWGVAQVTRALQARVVHDAELGGLRLLVEKAEWLREGAHQKGTAGANFAMPPGMTPGAPARGSQRLSVEVAVVNVAEGARRFEPGQLLLEAEGGERWEAESVPPLELQAGQRFATELEFDVPESERRPLSLRWVRAGSSVQMLRTVPPEHEEEEPAAPPAWPAQVEGLPAGDAAEGERLYHTRFACNTCHGQRGQPGSNTVGPPLEGFAAVAQARVKGRSAAQYAYESLLQPDAFLAPTCARGEPCTAPSAMPGYGEQLSMQQMADLVTYLMAQRVVRR